MYGLLPGGERECRTRLKAAHTITVWLQLAGNKAGMSQLPVLPLRHSRPCLAASCCSEHTAAGKGRWSCGTNAFKTGRPTPRIVVGGAQAWELSRTYVSAQSHRVRVPQQLGRERHGVVRVVQGGRHEAVDAQQLSVRQRAVGDAHLLAGRYLPLCGMLHREVCDSTRPSFELEFLRCGIRKEE